MRKTTCEECGAKVTLEIEDADGILEGNECPKCGYYVTRYVPGMKPKGL
jgi:DNA-directed RNA polymerase subunit RPC12/RpoP